jgi:hypothetical protein
MTIPSYQADWLFQKNMKAASMPTNTCPNLEEVDQPLRQWGYFPQTLEGYGSLASPQVFRLLVESSGRRMMIATVALRAAPDSTLAAELSGLIDERKFEFASRECISGEFDNRHGIAIELLDVDLDQDDPLKITAAIPRAIAQAAVQAGAILVSTLRTAVTQRLSAEWMATRSKFISHLDPEAVAQARAIGGLRPSSYSYLSTVNAEVRRNRAQALAVFPLMWPVLMTPQLDAVRNDIDEGRPLIDALALHYQATKAMIRVLCGVRPEDLDHSVRQLGTLVKLLHEIPPSWWPRDPATWRQFARATNTISRVSRHPITTATNQLWLRRSAQAGYQLSEITPEDIACLGQDIDEFMDTLRRALYWALPDPRNLCSHMPAKTPLEIAAALKANVGLEKLGEIVQRFGNAYRKAVTEFAEQAEIWRGVRWPALGDGDGVREYGEIVIRPLLAPADLTEEGTRMGSCVASYVEHCMKGKSQIWSVRLRDDTRGEIHLSTLETRVRTHTNGRKFLDVQVP